MVSRKLASFKACKLASKGDGGKAPIKAHSEDRHEQKACESRMVINDREWLIVSSE
jgi:hypothetical protein